MASSTSRWWRERAARPEEAEEVVAVAGAAEEPLQHPELHKSPQQPRLNGAMLPFLQCLQHLQRLRHLQRLPHKQRLGHPQPATIRNCSFMPSRTESTCEPD